ncbi:MAG TPA: hypothetical protein VD905_07930 [Flavobacteriales bacterium]|nr:hypothetical protein [Flavobacteriales bacterium]
MNKVQYKKEGSDSGSTRNAYIGQHAVRLKDNRSRSVLQRRRINAISNGNDETVIQGMWDYSELLSHDKGNILGPAVDVFTSGAKFTSGPGVALFRLTQKYPNKVIVQFRPVNKGKGTGGDTQLTFMDGTNVIGLHVDSNTIVRHPNLISEAQHNGLKIIINVNMDSPMNATTGGVINTLVHEFAVHAVNYYEIIRDLLDTDGDRRDKEAAVAKFDASEGVGGPPSKKAIINALSGGDEVETPKAKAEHTALAHGGTDYYKALVAELSDRQLNTLYHKWLTNNRKDFMKAQAEDVSGHNIGYNPDAARGAIVNILNSGTPMDELLRKSKELREASKLFAKGRHYDEKDQHDEFV